MVPKCGGGVSPGLALQLAELLGGPGGQSLGLVELGPAALSQQVIDEGPNLHHLHHVLSKRRAQVTVEGRGQRVRKRESKDVLREEEGTDVCIPTQKAPAMQPRAYPNPTLHLTLTQPSTLP